MRRRDVRLAGPSDVLVLLSCQPANPRQQRKCQVRKLLKHIDGFVWWVQ